MKNWKPQPLNFEVFKQQKPECGCVTEILACSQTNNKTTYTSQS